MSMSALNIDFVRPTRRVGVAGLLALSLAGLLGAWSAMDYTQLLAEQEQLQRRASRAQVGANARQGEGVRAVAATQSRAAMALLDLPWESLFDGTARVAASQQVGLLRVEADGVGKTLRLTAQARQFTAARNFVEQLQGLAPVSSASLVSHETVDEDGQSVLRFQVELMWRAQP